MVASSGDSCSSENENKNGSELPDLIFVSRLLLPLPLLRLLLRLLLPLHSPLSGRMVTVDDSATAFLHLGAMQR